MSNQNRQLVRASVFRGAGVPEFSLGGGLTKRELEAINDTREEYIRRQTAMRATEAIEYAGAEAIARMYDHAVDLYTTTTGMMILQSERVINKAHASYVNSFIADQCEELQRDLKGVKQVGVGGVGQLVERSFYQSGSPKKRGFLG